MLISTNRPVEESDEVFGDQVVAAAILDRLLHHSHVVTIRGDSYRLREKRRSGLFRPQTRRSEGKSRNSPTGINYRRQPTQPITKTMSKQRHRRRSQGGTTPETRPQTESGVAQFSVSEVAQFWMSVDKGCWEAPPPASRSSRHVFSGQPLNLEECVPGNLAPPMSLWNPERT